MKQRLWVPLVAVGLALAILVPTTFAVGEPGTTLYAQLGTNRFPGGQGSADAQLRFNSQNNIVLQIAIAGPAGTNNAVRVYVDGTCANPGIWVINRTPTAGPDGPFLEVASNSGPNTIQVNQLDVNRIRAELAGNPNETFALMVARLINGVNYRTCTTFRSTPFPPLTTTTATSPTQTTTTPATSTVTTRTITTVIGSQTLTLTLTQPVTTAITSTGTPTTITTTGTITSTVATIGTITSTGTAFTTGISTFETGDGRTTSTTFTRGTATSTVTQTVTSPITTITTTVTNVTTLTPITTSTFTL